MIPRKFEPVLNGLVLSGIMSLLVSGVATLHAAQPGTASLSVWASSWLTGWLVAFPSVLLAAPFTRSIVRRMVG
jgi:hypothetical protein